ncbi:MAG: hypothetical protein JSS09_09350 [Verrucomicrobia bacterium]|nr:hypothetical protein [Verrucomicrobiota bacterium]
MNGPINFHKGNFSKYPDYSNEEKLWGIYKELKNHLHLSEGGNFISNTSKLKNKLEVLNGLLNNHELLSMIIDNMEMQTSESIACSGGIIFNTMHLMTEYEDKKVASRFLDKILEGKPDFKKEDMTASHVQNSIVEYKQECESNTNLKKAPLTPARAALLQELASDLEKLQAILTILISASQSLAPSLSPKELSVTKQTPLFSHRIGIEKTPVKDLKRGLKSIDTREEGEKSSSEMIQGFEKANMEEAKKNTDRANAKRLKEEKLAEKHRIDKKERS